MHVKVFCTLYKLFIQGFHRGQYLVQACFWQNDLLEPLISRVILFADDSVVYHLVTSTLDQDQPQQDFLKLQLWEKSWDMVFHLGKYTRLLSTRKKETLNHNLSVSCTTRLWHCHLAKYLGVTIHLDLSWNEHVNKNCLKANKTFCFLRRNLQTKATKLKETTHKTLIRPMLEYACSV